MKTVYALNYKLNTKEPFIRVVVDDHFQTAGNVKWLLNSDHVVEEYNEQFYISFDMDALIEKGEQIKRNKINALENKLLAISQIEVR